MPQRELIGPNAPLHATLPLTGGEVFHAVDEDGNSVVIAVDDLPSGAASAITSPDTSVSLTATDEGLVVAGAGDLVAPTYGLGVDADGVVGRVPLVPDAVSARLDVVDAELAVSVGSLLAELADLDARVDDIDAHAHRTDNPHVVTAAQIGAATTGDLATAQADALDAKAPLVQSTAKTANYTVLATDAGDIIPLDSSTNGAFAVTFLPALFATAGANRAFVAQFSVVGFTSAITLVTTGFTLKSYGKAAVSAVDDIITVCIESASIIRIHIGAKL